jgi:hypothetical protein
MRQIFEEKKKRLIVFLKNNPKTTYKKIREKTKIHPERIFKSLEEGFKLAGVNPPRTFKIKTKEEKRKIVIDYLKKHPRAGSQTIAKEKKINIFSVFKNINEAYKNAGIKYPRRIDNRTRKEKKNEIINLIKENPLITTQEIIKKIKTQPYNFFKNVNEIYEIAGIPLVNFREKWKLKKQQKVITYIKENPLATQREINKSCRTHVQNIFDNGIFEAFKKSKIEYPYERLKLYGIGLKEVRNRARIFEEKISRKLSRYGKINRLVKTKRGFADILIERKNKKAVIEIKDYQKKEISIAEIKQLNNYLEDFKCCLGILICHKKPKKDTFLIGKNKIFVLTKDELDKIPKIMGP